MLKIQDVKKFIVNQDQFNFEDKTKGIYCSNHKKDGMINVLEKRICQEIDCKLGPSFNFEGEKKGIYCANHKKMLNLQDVKKLIVNQYVQVLILKTKQKEYIVLHIKKLV